MSECREIEILIPEHGPERDVALADLAAQLASLPETGFADIWVGHDPSTGLTALLSGDRGWLMYVRHDGDPGFSSRNAGYTGPADTEIDFMLSNGQVDRYPAAWTYPRAQILEAVSLFAHTGLLPESLSWFNDSGDGATAPQQRQR